MRTGWWVAIAAVVTAAVCGGVVLSVKLPGYASATRVEPPAADDLQTYGKADFSRLRRVGVVAGTVHKYACLQGGVAVPDQPQNVAEDVAAALRARGFEATVTGAGALAEEDNTHLPMQQLGQAPPEDLWVASTCAQLRQSETFDAFEGDAYQRLVYPATPSLARAMGVLPYDAVLVVNVNEESSDPYKAGGFMSGSSATPAAAHVELGAQLLMKDGSVPWSATVSAKGSLLHEGGFWSNFASRGTEPELGPVRAAAVGRLVAAMPR